MTATVRKKSKFNAVGIVLTDDLASQLSAEAERRTISKSAVVREALIRYLKAVKREEE